MADTESLRTATIKSIEYEGAKGKITPQRQTELKKLAAEIATSPEFLALENKRTSKIVEMQKDGIDVKEAFDIAFRSSQEFKDYGDYVDGKLKAAGIPTTIVKEGLGEVNGKMVRKKVEAKGYNPEGELVYVLLTKSEEALFNARAKESGKSPISIPSAHEISVSFGSSK